MNQRGPNMAWPQSTRPMIDMAMTAPPAARVTAAMTLVLAGQWRRSTSARPSTPMITTG